MNNIMSTQYLGSPFYFCSNNNPFYLVKNCNGTEVLQFPKKAVVFNKQQHSMTKVELLSWASKNRYR
jgi:Zn-finger protein